MKQQFKRKHHTGRIVFFCVLIALSGLTASLFLIRAETVTVTGNRYVTDELIMAHVFPDDQHKSLFHVLLGRFFKKTTIPGLSSVSIVPKELKHCEIRVQEEAVVCQVFDGRFYNLLTSEGIVLARLTKPAETAPQAMNVTVKSADVLSHISVSDDEAIKTVLIYASRFFEEEIPVDTLTVEKDGIRAQIGRVTVILGSSFGAAEKVSELKDMYPKWQDLDLKGILHMEEFTLEKGSVGTYFEVIPD